MVKQKRSILKFPKLNDFIHNVYIQVSRKLYTNVYLLKKILSHCSFRKIRETEIIIRESILNTVRENIPVEAILRAYLDETEEDEIIEETEEIIERPKTEQELKEEAEKQAKEEEEKEKEQQLQAEASSSSIQVDKSESEFTSINEEEEKEALNKLKPDSPSNAISANVAGELTNSSDKKRPITISTERPELSFNNIDSAIGINKKRRTDRSTERHPNFRRN